MSVRQARVFVLGFSLLLLWAPLALRAEDGEDGYAGSDACRDCHQAAYKSMTTNGHWNKVNAKTPVNDRGCESCHGPMQKHVDEEGEHGAPPVSPEACLNCHHRETVALWQGSVHERRELSCGSCHNPHEGNKEDLRGATESDTCNGCHKDIQGQILKSSHHPIREGKMECSDCHNPHGTVADNLISADTLNQKCYECHADKRGPFLWEHAPVTEDCTSCHAPHGSSYEFLMVNRTPFICQQCHSNARHPGTLYALDASKPGATAYNAGNNRIFYRNCLNCHIQIHGSNHPSGKALAR